MRLNQSAEIVTIPAEVHRISAEVVTKSAEVHNFFAEVFTIMGHQL
ncbi:hypothetical protein [Lentibacillus sp. CBA3610]|nr:hypothetical protein [Lentibacillus sp. CBA3610]